MLKQLKYELHIQHVKRNDTYKRTFSEAGIHFKHRAEASAWVFTKYFQPVLFCVFEQLLQMFGIGLIFPPFFCYFFSMSWHIQFFRLCSALYWEFGAFCWWLLVIYWLRSLFLPQPHMSYLLRQTVGEERLKVKKINCKLQKYEHVNFKLYAFIPWYAFTS